MPYRLIGADQVHTEVFVEPSDEARALLRLAPRLIDQQPEGPLSARRLLRDALVAPFTQLTFLSFDLQDFLFGVFHTTWTARMGHLVGMTLVNLFLMAGFSELTAALPGVDGGALYAGALLCWYAAISRDARLALWWLAMVPVVGGLYALSQAFLVHTTGLTAAWSSPWLLVLASALVISLSHAPEPRFPPRAGDPLAWVSVPDFVRGPAGARNPSVRVLRRALRVALYPWIGLVDELWASPRLLPYNVLHLLFAVGYAPRRAAELQDRVDRALASGNPAIDFVGIGGGVVLAPEPP